MLRVVVENPWLMVGVIIALLALGWVGLEIWFGLTQGPLTQPQVTFRHAGPAEIQSLAPSPKGAKLSNDGSTRGFGSR
jgi:hypothetical protein